MKKSVHKHVRPLAHLSLSLQLFVNSHQANLKKFSNKFWTFRKLYGTAFWSRRRLMIESPKFELRHRKLIVYHGFACNHYDTLTLNRRRRLMVRR